MEQLDITPELAGATVAAVLRNKFPDHSWKAVRRWVAGRRVRVNADLCLDPARRLKAGDTLEVLDHPLPKLPAREDIVLRHLDRHVVVLEKPAADLLAALKTGKQLKVSFQNMAKETISIPMPLNDFAAAYDKIK